MGKKKKKQKKKKGRSALVWLIAVVSVSAIGYFAFSYISINKMPNFRKETIVFVRPESTVEDVYASIVREAGVRRPYSLNKAFEQKKVAEYLKPGRYVIKPEYTSVYVARMLNNCWQTPALLVLSGTMRQNSQIAGKISNQLMIDSLDVISALENKELLAKFGFTPKNVFSLFIPDTYEMFWTANMEDVLKKQKQAYDDFWTVEREQKAAAQGLTKEEVSVLASIVKGETNYEPEMPKIAGVYLNRLHKGMRLQADPTIAYCLNYQVTRILNKHLKIDSPYNTYVHTGLPPGPIAVPTKACLDAVLNPEGDNFYFCANSNFDGSHLFAKNYNDHLKNARLFQKALNERARSRK